MSAGEPLGDAGAWVLSEKTFDANGVMIGNGDSISIRDIAGQCPNLRTGAGDPLPTPESVNQCLGDLGVHTVFEYHPAGRFWTFQLIETGLLLGLAGVAIAVGAISLRRRTA